MSHGVTDNHLLIYVEHLKAVKKDVNVCFKDLLDLEVFPWLVEPFVSNITECDATMQVIIDLQSDRKYKQFLGHMDEQVSGSSVIIDFQNCGRK